MEDFSRRLAIDSIQFIDCCSSFAVKEPFMYANEDKAFRVFKIQKHACLRLSLSSFLQP